MLTLPVSIIRLLEPFGAIFQVKTWEKAQLLLVGAILSPGKRTVTSALRVLGLSGDGNFARYHHVLNRARWSSLQLSRTLLFLLLRHLDSGVGPLVLGIDETIERRRGKRISAKGIYRDGVRSSGSHFVKASGLRWIVLRIEAALADRGVAGQLVAVTPGFNGTDGKALDAEAWATAYLRAALTRTLAILILFGPAPGPFTARADEPANDDPLPAARSPADPIVDADAQLHANRATSWRDGETRWLLL